MCVDVDLRYPIVRYNDALHPMSILFVGAFSNQKVRRPCRLTVNCTRYSYC